MYEVNGVDLTSSEWDTLKRLVDSDDHLAAANSMLMPDGKTFDFCAVEVFCSLKDHGLISGMPIHNGFQFHDLTRAGRDFVIDWHRSQEIELECVLSERRHSWRVAAFGAIARCSARRAISVGGIQGHRRHALEELDEQPNGERQAKTEERRPHEDDDE